VPFSRRGVLILVAGVAALGTRVGRAHAAPPDAATLRQALKKGISRDGSDVFGLDVDTASEVLQRVTRDDALPDGYTPTDLVSSASHGIDTWSRQYIRELIVDDTYALVAAASEAGLRLYVGSGFRSQSYQEAVFNAQTVRVGDTELANRYSATPGHSQHQLGTTIDFTTDFRAFRTNGAGDWLRDNAHDFGFVLPYTQAASDRTGYVDEPWHGRWVGPDLARLLQSLGYQQWATLAADDAIGLLRDEAGFDR
jgi:D-alanyl-D-alanine carboxypeptidase